MGPLHSFRNRLHAGKQLAAALAHHAGTDAIVLALPRGGVPVGFVVAHELGLALDVLIVRKLGLPGHEEFAIGAVGSGGVRIVQPEVLDACGVSPTEVEPIVERELAEVARRERLFRGARPPPVLAGRAVILVDDGLATGSTMQAAIEVARQQAPARLVAAIPVGAALSCMAIAPEVDELVCLLRPPHFRAVSQWYRQFEQTSDEEVQDLLALAWREQAQHPLPTTTHPHRYGGTA
ncbi:MAG: phosphoribosyltransferase [Pseudomonadota bacterium]